MRFDSEGLFWADTPPERGKRGQTARAQPPIPSSTWVPACEFPLLRSAPCISIDTETYDPELLDNGPGWARGKGHIVGVSIAVPGHSWYFPVRHTIQPEFNLDPIHVFSWLRDTLGHKDQPKLGAHLLYDIGWLLTEGVAVCGDLVDVQYAEALLQESNTVALEDLGQRYLGIGKQTDILEKWCMDAYGGPKSEWRSNIHRAPTTLVGPYAEQDAVLPIHVAAAQYPRLLAEGLYDLFRLECGLVPLLVAMRWRGVKVDLNKAEQVRDMLLQRETDLQRQLKDMVGFEVNTNAGDSLAKAFDQLSVKYGRTATGKPSFTKMFLEALEHPVGEIIRDIRQAAKLRSTFVQSYLLESHINGRVHCQFHPLRGDGFGTRSGRLSSSNPNLQNIPIRDKILAPMLRGLFLPDYGYWRRFDTSQVEYRWLAHFAIGSGSDDIRNRYLHDPSTDYHNATQDMIFNLTQIALDRYPVKTINFGLIYGMGEPKLARSLKLSAAEGKSLFIAYHQAVPFAKATMDACSEEAQRTGAITTVLGRKSRFELWEPYSTDYDNRAPGLHYDTAVMQYGRVKRAYTHKALNRRLQGSAADLMKVAMLECWKQGLFGGIGVPHLTVHDELDFSDDLQHNAQFKEIARIMETAIPARIPFRVETEVGPDWGHLKKEIL